MEYPRTHISLILLLQGKPSGRQQSSDQGWTEFHGIYCPLLQRWCERAGLQHVDAMEVANELVGDLVKDIRQYDPKRGSFRSWLCACAKNRSCDFHRRAARERQAVQDNYYQLLQSPASQQDLERSIGQATDELEETLKAFWQLVELVQADVGADNWQMFERLKLANEPAAAIAQAFGIAAGTVYVRVHRVVKKLRSALDRYVQRKQTKGAADHES